MNYYNEWDSFAAEWLKQLIKDGLIPNGEVDSRSIADVEPSDLKGFTQCHFFAGIGGWSRALQIAGWSSDRPVWTGSPPCQSFSTAGSRKGKDDERHLWPVFFNLIRECQPPTVFGEQVAAAIRFGWLDDLQIDFEKEGYAAGAFVLPSGSIGAPHKRDRLFFVADSNAERLQRRPEARRERSKFECEDGSQIRSVARSDASISSVADSNDLGHEWSEGVRWEAQRGAEHAGSVSMADPNIFGHERQRLVGRSGRSEEAKNGETSSSIKFGANSMADSVSERSQRRLQGRQDKEWENISGRLRCGGSIDSLVNSDSNRPKSRDETAKTARHRDSIDSASFWSDSREIYCRDGKYRSIPSEPALFPLADGISNRVGILRGAGNAIVPQAAAEIIKAYLYD